MKKKVLFLVPGRLGDALMLSPALALLKQLQPQYEIDVLATSPLGADIFKNNPNCTQVYAVTELAKQHNFIELYDFLVAAHRDNKILELSNKFAKPLLIVGAADLEKHQSQQALEFVHGVFAEDPLKPNCTDYQLFPSQHEESYAARLLDKNRKYVGLHLGCHSVNKKINPFAWLPAKQHKKVWPLKKFVELAKQIKLQGNDYQIVLTGGSNERYLAEDFKKYVPDAIDLIGKTEPLQLAAVMRHFSAYICPDTGTMHMACAMNIPLVALFGPTNAKRTGPYPPSKNFKVIYSENTSDITVQEVMSALNSFE